MLSAIRLESHHWAIHREGDPIEGAHFILSFGEPPVYLQVTALPVFQVPVFPALEKEVDAKRRAWATLQELQRAFQRVFASDSP